LNPTNKKKKRSFTEFNGKKRQNFNIFQLHSSDKGEAGWTWNSAPLPQCPVPEVLLKIPAVGPH
jgi:hypothetical protein